MLPHPLNGHINEERVEPIHSLSVRVRDSTHDSCLHQDNLETLQTIKLLNGE